MHDSSTRSRTLIAIATIVVVLVVDQIIKISVKTSMLLGQTIDVASWCKIHFVENKGMAFGMEFVGTLFLTVFRLAATVLFVALLVKAIRRRYPCGLIFCLALIIAGAAGNIIDNCFYGLIFSESTPFSIASFVPFGSGYGSFLAGRVVDMFYFPLFTWPDWMPIVGGNVFFGAIFNFADAAISCGGVAIVLCYYKTLFSGQQKTC